MRDYFNCKECVDLLMEFVEERLDPETHAQLDEHLSSCPPCLHFLKSYKTCTELSRQLRDQEVHIPVEVESRLKSFLKENLRG